MTITPRARTRHLRGPFLCLLVLAVGLPAMASAQGGVRIQSESVACLPVGDNGVGWARVENLSTDQSVRLHFRRLNDVVEDFYWVDMHPEGNGRYWGVFPKAADEALKRHDVVERRDRAQAEAGWAEWWRAKDASDDRNPNSDLDQEMIRERASQGKLVERHWLAEMDDSTFQHWLEQLENEPTEYYTSVNDPRGNEVARSKTSVAEVKSSCRPDLTPTQRGEAENLVIGESAYWQRDEAPFHWLCEGIVTRVDPSNVKRSDEACRACVIAWWRRPGILVPVAAGLGAVAAGYEIVNDDEPIGPVPPPPASPDNP